MTDQMIGRQLANFRVERLIGQGGMATVYLGQDVKLQRPVAIKVIDKRYKNDPAYTSRFIKEARMMAKWRHENLIQIFYADEEKGHSYYVMEYVDGNDLSTVMSMYADEGELMPIADVLRIGNAVAGALDYAHSQGVIHRDVKPSNVLIANDGRVLVGDFGMAMEVSDGSMGNIFGTPHYISPEQARRSADAVPQSDLYSLGVILYEILTGSVPFNDPSPASIALQHISQPPPSLRSLNPEISPAVEAVVLKALDKSPKNRYQTGAQLMGALNEAIKAVASSPKISLPPLPVGVPTIRRSGIPIDHITKRNNTKVKGSTIHQPVDLPATVRGANQNKKGKRWGLALLALLLLFGIGGWYMLKNRPTSATDSPTPAITPAPLESTVEPAQPTETLISAPATALQPTVEASPIPSPVVPVVIPTIKYRDGNNLTLFWNETSFHMLNRSGEPRSLSGFSFERLDPSGKPTDRFPGHLWENLKFNYIPSKYCVSIKIYKDEDPPYIDPPDCHGGYVSIIQPRKDEDAELFFWNLKEDSTQFRVVWVGEEVARCDISAGTCEVYIP
ncbi:serine/threonine-protein kinase [Candidatus Villigracilis affinis]|uniref:serine/threonine protein kinase n=1 Tax=Candidatus Villigracilis affinis TaxID=3140682 RepID=UPI002A1DB18D|nr:serine/threonine protein kinase [Anaerolineales bacterium]